MTDIPDNVDLNWIARHLVEMRGEFGGLRDDVRTLLSRPTSFKDALMTEKPSAAYLAGYFFGREGRRTERRFDDVGIEIKAYAEGIVDGRRTARAAEDWRKVVEHERSLGLHWQDRLNIQNPQVSDPDAPFDPN